MLAYKGFTLGAAAAGELAFFAGSFLASFTGPDAPSYNCKFGVKHRIQHDVDVVKWFREMTVIYRAKWMGR